MLPLLVLFLSQLKPVQQAVAGRALTWLSEKLNTEVKLDGISWRRLHTLELHGFLIRDQQADTLLSANRLIVHFNFWKLIQSELLIDEVDLTDAYIRLNRDSSNNWNFSFIAEAFPANPDTSQEIGQFIIRPDLIHLQQIRLDYSDVITSSQLNNRLGEVSIQVDKLDIYHQVLSLKSLVIQEPDIAYLNTAVAVPVLDTLPGEFSFPDIGWTINIDQTQLNSGRISYRETKTDKGPAGIFNPADIEIQDLFWDIRQLRNDSAQISASIQSFSLKEKSGFHITQLRTDLHFSDTKASLRDFELTTPDSYVRQSLEFEYPDLNALEILSNSSSIYNPSDIYVEALISDFSLSPLDVRRFDNNIIPNDLTEPITLNGSVSGTLAELTIQENITYPELQFQLSSEGQLKDILDADRFYFDLRIDTLQANYEKLKTILPDGTLAPEFQRWGTVDLHGRIKGTIADFETQSLQIETRSGPQFKGDAHIVGLPQYRQATYSLQLDRLSTRMADWNGFLPDTLPAILKNVDQLVLRGTFDGSLSEFNTNLILELKEGNILTTTHVDFEDDYSNARYDGRIQLQEFDLGSFLQDSAIGIVNLDLNIDGQGLQLADLDAEIAGVLSNPTYNNYRYDSLFLKGQLDSTSFVGNINMNDPNLAFVFDGRIPFMDSLPNFRFTLQLDTINLKPLGLYATPLGLRTYVALDLWDYRIDDLKGNLVLTNLTIQDSINKFHADSIYLNSTVDETGLRQLTLQSEWLQLAMEGHYTLSKLPLELLDWLDQDFPINRILFPVDSTNQNLEIAEYDGEKTNIKAYLKVEDILPVTKIFLPELKKLDPIELYLEFDKGAELWDLQTTIPVIEYANYRIDSLSLFSYYKQDRLTNILKSSTFRAGENTSIYQPAIEAIMKDDSLYFELLSSESTDSVSWNIGGALTTNNNEILLQFAPQIRLNGESWEVPPGNQLIYSSDNQWQINQLRLNKDSGSISLNGAGNPYDSTSLLNIAFNQFEIDALTPFLDLPTGFMTGLLNGELEARDLQTNLNYIANLDLQNWTMDSVRIGNVTLYAEQLNNEPIINLSAALEGLVNQLNVSGTYNIQQKLFDVKAAIGRLDMQALDPFLPGLIHDSNGYLTGAFSLKGSPDLPSLNGSLQLHQLKTTIDYVNIPYSIADGTISFTEKKIDFGEIRMRDANNQQARLSGVVKHSHFKDMVLDLRLKTDRFQFLNTTAADNKLFYGDLILESDIEIQGPINQARFFIHAKTQSGTQFFVIPLSDEQVLSQDDFIIFGIPALDSLGRDTSLVNNPFRNESGIDLSLNLEMTSDASLEIIIDPLTGDKLQCSGISNLAVDMDPDGSLIVVGNYQITEGKYSFSYEQLLKREFVILPNSKISFNGDPLRAQLDITAAYQLRVPLTDLVQDQLTEENISIAGQRADVQLQMKISGDLIAPILSFDIILLGNPQGTVADAARTRLQQLRTNETELNTQVFGLLLFNSFINPSNSAFSVSNAGETALLSSLSKLVTNELNRLAGGLLKGVDFRLGVEAYKPGLDASGSDGITTEVQLGVSKKLWNDRLNVTVGGNINVGNTGQEQQALTALTGDFALEYQLTPDGNYLLRVYQRSDYDALYEGNVNKGGAGISIRKTLLNKERKRKE
ncbi:MAG: translocation/assembly module TamB domain-containing protein [Saprospiraceae bacterium]|nr:translocation/assembly module TamB domain-containing protein [Saprospiraceae bacterium]